MKTRFKLLMFVLVVVVAVLCVAACDFGGGGGDDTTTAATTTAAATTTEAPVTTAAPAGDDIVAGQVHPHAANVQLNVSTATYTGSAIRTGYGVVGRGNKVSVTLSFQQIDPQSGEALAGVAAVAQPVQAGTYTVTATFAWANSATAADKVATLPEPIVKRFVVTPMELTDNNVKFGAQNYETFYYAGMNVAVDSISDIVTGTVFTGLERTFTLEKVADAAGTNPVAATAITEAGYYKVTVNYVEPTGAANFTNEATVSHTAIINVRQLANTAMIKKAPGAISIDGVADAAYADTAVITSVYQAGGNGSGRFELGEDDVMGNPYEAINMINIHKGTAVQTVPDSTVTIKTLWGVEGTETFLYVLIEVEDDTVKSRSLEYLSQPDAWVNDSIEFAYKLGGYEMPKLPTGSETYPTYSTVTIDARVKDALNSDGNNHATIPQAKSFYYDDIKSATAWNYDGADVVGYTIELKIPAMSESFTGQYGYAGWNREGGEALTAGEFVFFAVQQNNLTYTGDIAAYDANIPKDGTGAVIKKYATDADIVAGNMSPEWKAFEAEMMQYMYCSGNRNMFYLATAGAGPIVFQISDAVAGN